MAIFRKIHTSFWSDSFIQDLEQSQKLFYLYLLTNERTRQCGVYEITKKQISYDLGYTIDRVSILLDFFIKSGKVKYNEVTKELAIGNWLKFNNSTSPKVKSCIDKEFGYCKDTVLIEYVKSMDTASQEEEEEEQEEIYNIVLNKIFTFNEFWELYPIKTSKQKSEQIFSKLKDAELQKIKDTLKSFITYKPFENYNHPNPTTYLNQKRWDDMIPDVKVAVEQTKASIIDDARQEWLKKNGG